MFDKETLVHECMAALRERSPQQAVKEIVRRAVAQPAEIDRAFGVPEKAGIETVYRSEELTVLRVIWAPYMALYPHNHESWAVIGLYGGQEDNTFYRRRKEGIGLDRVNGRSLEDGDTIVLGEHAIHSVANPRRTFAGAIHVYGGDFFSLPRSEWDSEDSPERPFSIEQAMRAFAEADERARRLQQQPAASGG